MPGPRCGRAAYLGPALLKSASRRGEEEQGEEEGRAHRAQRRQLGLRRQEGSPGSRPLREDEGLRRTGVGVPVLVVLPALGRAVSVVLLVVVLAPAAAAAPGPSGGRPALLLLPLWAPVVLVDLVAVAARPCVGRIVAAPGAASGGPRGRVPALGASGGRRVGRLGRGGVRRQAPLLLVGPAMGARRLAGRRRRRERGVPERDRLVRPWDGHGGRARGWSGGRGGRGVDEGREGEREGRPRSVTQAAARASDGAGKGGPALLSFGWRGRRLGSD